MASEYLQDIEDLGGDNHNKWRRKITTSLEAIQYHASYVTMVHYYFQTIDIPVDGEGKTFTVKEFVEIVEKATMDSEFGVMTKRL